MVLKSIQKVNEKDTDKYGIISAKHIEDRVYKEKNLVEKSEIRKAPSNIAILLLMLLKN